MSRQFRIIYNLGKERLFIDFPHEFSTADDVYTEFEALNIKGAHGITLGFKPAVTLEQYHAIQRLHDEFSYLSGECENDNFNDFISELDIVSRSLDELVYSLGLRLELLADSLKASGEMSDTQDIGVTRHYVCNQSNNADLGRAFTESDLKGRGVDFGAYHPITKKQFEDLEMIHRLYGDGIETDDWINVFSDYINKFIPEAGQ